MEEEFIEVCKSCKDIYIYGAGKNGEAIYRYLREREIQIKGFLVSNMVGNPDYLFGKKVSAVADFKEARCSLIVVPVSSKGKAYKEICDTLVDYQIHNVYFIPLLLLQLICMEGDLRKNREFFNNGKYHFGEKIPVEAEYGILVMKGAGDKEYHWRFPIFMTRKQTVGSVQELFAVQSALDEFEEMYGKYHIFPADELRDSVQRGTYAIYMARSHVDKQIVVKDFPFWIIPIQVGAALTEADICELKDNTGENISEKNGNYSECTAIYWIWKNAPRTDYIGLCHYRRHFVLEENAIGGLAALDIDVLLTSPSFVAETVETFFSTLIPNSDMRAMIEAIRKVWPEYLPAAERFLKGRFYPPCNIFAMKYNIFQEYGEFAFSVAFEIERFFDKIGFYRQDRYMGFIMECLLGIFVIKNKERLKTAYTDMEFYQ